MACAGGEQLHGHFRHRLAGYLTPKQPYTLVPASIALWANASLADSTPQVRVRNSSTSTGKDRC